MLSDYSNWSSQSCICNDALGKDKKPYGQPSYVVYR